MHPKYKAPRYLIQHLDAGNDKNGNPRRLYTIYNNQGNMLAAIDEGYKGLSAIPDTIRNNCEWLAELTIPYYEYKDLLNCPNRLNEKI